MDGTTPAPEVMMERAAKIYAARGWPVLPLHRPLATGCTCGQQTCPNRGKHPRTLHGAKDASRALAAITAWWQAEPISNVGIATGAASGLVVLDVDPQHGGEESLRLLEECFVPLPPTLVVATGGGGSHYYFRAPAPGEGALPNKVGIAGLPGVDVRSDGGYIVAPPSLHRSGECYRWISAGPLAPLPYWLFCLLVLPLREQREQPYALAHAERARTTHSNGWLPPEEYWFQAALRRVTPGTRNAVGYWLAKRLQEKEVEEPAARTVLRHYAARVEGWGDHPYTEEEALASLESAYRS